LIVQASSTRPNTCHLTPAAQTTPARQPHLKDKGEYTDTDTITDKDKDKDTKKTQKFFI